ncbi:centrosomal protein 15 [Aplochiton taeniatus]
MAAVPEEVQLSKKHEEILGKRAMLLREMESRYEQQKTRRKHQLKQSKSAHERNNQLLKDLQSLEENLTSRQLPHPNIILLETQYWASIEKQIPEWESFLLGKGPHPSDSSSRPPKEQKLNVQGHTHTKDKTLPPRPLPRTVI